MPWLCSKIVHSAVLNFDEPLMYRKVHLAAAIHIANSLLIHYSSTILLSTNASLAGMVVLHVHYLLYITTVNRLLRARSVCVQTVLQCIQIVY